MYKIKEAIIVEGNYDKIKLSGFIDGIIITTHGFAIYSNEEYIKTIERLANETGIVILTDSDWAGMRIRNFVKQKAGKGIVKHAYIPDIEGKEKRKKEWSAEGLLGVEGMTEEVIIKALRDAGCEIDNADTEIKNSGITKSDLFMLGLSGGKNSSFLRDSLAGYLQLPKGMSCNAFLDCINAIYEYNEFIAAVKLWQQEEAKR